MKLSLRGAVEVVEVQEDEANPNLVKKRKILTHAHVKMAKPIQVSKK